jgi:hypothetical protein
MARYGCATRRRSSQAGCTTRRTTGWRIAHVQLFEPEQRRVRRGGLFDRLFAPTCKTPYETSNTRRKGLLAPSRRIGYVGQILNASFLRARIREWESDPQPNSGSSIRKELVDPSRRHRNIVSRGSVTGLRHIDSARHRRGRQSVICRGNTQVFSSLPHAADRRRDRVTST